MKVLIIRTHGSVVNLNTYNSQDLGMARAMLRKGIQCDIVYFGGKQETHIQEIETKEGIVLLYWVKGISVALNGIFFGLNRIIKNYDVVQVGDYDQLTSIWLAFFSRYRSKVVLYHGPYLCDYNKKYRLKCRVVDLLPLPKKIKNTLPCFAKSILAEQFLRDRGFKNITTVGVGLDTERFDEVDETPISEVADILEKTRNKKTLLYIGLIEPRRNTDFLIRTFASVRENYTDVCLIMVGRGEDSYKNDVFRLVDELNVSECVFYIPSIKQSQLPFLYKNASLFLLPTSYEIFGMVLMEAMYYKLPVITTKNGGSLTLINQDNGYTNDLDITQWHCRIIELLSNERLAREMGLSGNKTIKEKCSWDAIVDTMVSHYKQKNEEK